MARRSTSIIEERGDLVLKDFFDDSELIHPLLALGDKELSWDGNIDLYRDNSRTKQSHDFRVPVQVKAKEADLPEKNHVVFYLDKAHGTNYLKNGGVLFLRPIFKDKRNYKIYTCPLLPVHIKMLLEEYQERASIPLKCYHVENIDKFIGQLKFFNENRVDQGAVYKRQLIKYIPENTELIYKTIGNSKYFMGACKFFCVKLIFQISNRPSYSMANRFIAGFQFLSGIDHFLEAC